MDSNPALAVASMLVLVPTALGGGWAGITRQYRLAALLLGIAGVILLPYVWAWLVLPEV